VEGAMVGGWLITVLMLSRASVAMGGLHAGQADQHLWQHSTTAVSAMWGLSMTRFHSATLPAPLRIVPAGPSGCPQRLLLLPKAAARGLCYKHHVHQWPHGGFICYSAAHVG
jgi:hypothetical protein